MSVYLDYNASAPIDSRVLECMVDVYQNAYGNADSRTHTFGEKARTIVEDARQQVAQLAGCKSNEVFFTSGATESNNIAIQGLKEYGEKAGKKHIIVSMIEHKAILETAHHMEEQGFEVDYVRPQRNGRLLVNDVCDLVRDDTLLVSIMHVNNETGIIQPVKEIGDALSTTGVLFHIDATQSFGKLVEDIRNIKYDIMSVSAHKLSGPQGVGAIFLRRKRYKLPPIKPILFGGSQEHGIHPGTLPVALIAGFGKACEIADREHNMVDSHCRLIKEHLKTLLDESSLEYSINGEDEYSMCNTLNLRICGVSPEALMLATKEHCGISNGSACNSSDYSPSYVLRAMGIPDEEIMESIRISWGGRDDVELIKEEFEELLHIAQELK